MIVVAGRYELLGAVGAGRTATVFRARDRRDGATVALKLVPPPGAVEGHARLAHEARLLGKMRSRHVPRVHAHGLDELNGAYLVTELVDGSWLAVEVLARPFLPHEVLRAARGLLEALTVVHAAGLVHHDLKPSNVLVRPERLEAAVLVDFGSATDASALEPGAGVPGAWATARYAAPERLLGAAGDARSDVFSAGVLLYELLGHPLARAGGEEHEGMALPLEPLVPKPLSTLLARMVALDPSRRFATAGEALALVLDLDTAPIEQGAPLAPRGSAAPPTNPSAETASTRSRASPEPLPERGSPAAGLSRLDDAPLSALREVLQALDLPLLDALARRGGAASRAARGASLALRLDGQAAAAALAVPDASEIDSAVAYTLALPLAARSIVDALPHAFVDTALLPPALGAVLAIFAAVLAVPDDAKKTLSLVRASAARLRERRESHATELETLHVAERVLSTQCEDRPIASAIAECLPIVGRDAPSPLDRLARGLLLGAAAIHVDPSLARGLLERAATAAFESRCALIEARVLTELGRLMVLQPATREAGVGWLVRVEALVCDAWVPTLAHASHHERGTAALLRGSFEEAARHYARARATVLSERRTDAQVLSGAWEVLARLSSGDREKAVGLVDELVEPRLAFTLEPTAAIALVARAMVALAGGGVTRARRDLERARARAVRVVGRGSQDAAGLVEMSSALLRAALLEDDPSPGEHMYDTDERSVVATTDLARVMSVYASGASSTHAFLPMLRAIFGHVPDAKLRVPLIDAVDRALAFVRDPPSRERPTEPPPPPS